MGGLKRKQAKQQRMEVDSRTGLHLPEQYFLQKRLEWFEALLKELDDNSIEYKRTETDTLIIKSKHSAPFNYLEFDTQATQILDPKTYVGMVKQWASGGMKTDAIYRMLTPNCQVEVSNRMRLKPNSTDGGNVQEWLNQELKKREDLRRQGFDPKQEGLA